MYSGELSISQFLFFLSLVKTAWWFRHQSPQNTCLQIDNLCTDCFNLEILLCIFVTHHISRKDCYTPRFNEVERGVYWYHLVRLSVRPSVCLSVCGQNRVRSVSSTILIGSISYLHILSSNFRRCVACNARFNIQKFEILANFLNL